MAETVGSFGIKPPVMPVLRRFAVAAGAATVVAALWVGSGLLVPSDFVPITDRLRSFVTIFFGIFVEALPFLLAGVLVSSAIHLYVTPDRLQRMIPRSAFGAAVMGSLLGLAFPVCECGSIPAARRLMQKGAPQTLGIAFVLAAPVINPIVIISTSVAFVGVLGWSFVAWRIGLTILIAVAIALLLGVTRFGAGEATALLLSNHEHDHDHHHGDSDDGAIMQLLGHASNEFFEMSKFLVIGGMLAAALQTLVPPTMLTNLGQGPVLSVLVLMALAVMLSICSTVDSFVALSFVGTFAPGALLAFLVFGPMIDIKSALMLTTTFPRRTVVALICLSAGLVAAITITMNLVGGA